MSSSNQEIVSSEAAKVETARFHPVVVQPPHVRLLRYMPTLILLGLAVHLLLPQIASLEHSVGVFKEMTWWLVALAAASQITSYFATGYLVKSIVTMTRERLDLLRGIAIVLSANSVGLVAGGMVGNSASAYRWLKQGGVSPETASLASTLPSMLNNLLLLLLALFGLFHLLVAHQLTFLEEAGFALVVLAQSAVVVVFVWGIARPAPATRAIDRFIIYWDRIRQRQHDPDRARLFVDQLKNIWVVLLEGGWRGPVLGVILNIGFDLLTIYLLFLAVGHPILPSVLVTGYGLPLLLGKVSFLPGGVGLVEGTMVALYTGLGVPASTAVVVVLAYRVLSFWLPTLLGFPIVPFLERSANEVPGRLKRTLLPKDTD